MVGRPNFKVFVARAKRTRPSRSVVKAAVSTGDETDEFGIGSLNRNHL